MFALPEPATLEAATTQADASQTACHGNGNDWRLIIQRWIDLPRQALLDLFVSSVLSTQSFEKHGVSNVLNWGHVG